MSYSELAPPLCSDIRRDLCEYIEAVPRWRRWLLCKVLLRAKAKRAHALNVAAGEFIFEPDDRIGREILRRADGLWAEIYDYPNADAHGRAVASTVEQIVGINGGCNEDAD